MVMEWLKRKKAGGTLSCCDNCKWSVKGLIAKVSFYDIIIIAEKRPTLTGLILTIFPHP